MQPNVNFQKQVADSAMSVFWGIKSTESTTKTMARVWSAYLLKRPRILGCPGTSTSCTGRPRRPCTHTVRAVAKFQADHRTAQGHPQAALAVHDAPAHTRQEQWRHS